MTAPDPLRRRGDARLGRRLLTMLALLAGYFVLEVVAKALVVLQFLIVAVRGRPNALLTRWGAMLARYMYSMWLFGVFAADVPPWPFSAWPCGWANVPVMDAAVTDKATLSRRPQAT